jgi:superfamily II DNA/RNA helicase
MENYNEVIPRIHHIVEFEELKLVHLLSVLDDIYAAEGQLQRVVILTSLDRTAKNLGAQLTHHNIRVTSVSGSRKPRRKRRATDGFNGGRFQVLIVSQSGLDAETGEIFHFINYDMVLPYPLNNAGGLRVRNRRHG